VTSPALAPALATGELGPILECSGHCPTCDQDVRFVARDPWLRDHFRCSSCGSIPRERALMAVLARHYPNWRDLTIHETSPEPRGASARLARECPGYIPSQCFPDQAPGSMAGAVRCENLEALTFADESIDLHISQDVLEHVFHPARAFREIARTLRTGGSHIFTVPMMNGAGSSRVRATMGADGQVRHLETPVFHGNPISAEGVLVTMDWGLDIGRHIFEACGLYTQVFQIDDLQQGIRAEFIEVFVTRKTGGNGHLVDVE
jgi:SAM-dependent methyltransferase